MIRSVRAAAPENQDTEQVAFERNMLSRSPTRVGVTESLGLLNLKWLCGNFRGQVVVVGGQNC